MKFDKKDLRAASDGRLDAYSAGISSETVFPKINGKWVAVGATVFGIICAVIYPMDNIVDFLYLIGSVFAPMIAIQVADFFLLKQDSSKSAFNVPNLIVWAVGFILYRFLMGANLLIGSTLPDMAVTIFICAVLSKMRHYD
jgi:purine-cytosine permease-like protein